MDTAWILVAHRSGAQLFENRDRELSLLQEIPHADGQPRDAGRTDQMRYAVGSEQQEAAEREAMKFVRELAGLLEDGRVRKRYDRLVLVAEPRFLGELRSAVTPQTGALIAATQSKDMTRMDTQAIKEYLQNFVWPSPRKSSH